LEEQFEGVEGPGLYVYYLYDKGAAEDAGLQRGDVIVELNGEPVSGASDFGRAITAMEIGAEAKVAFVRGGKRETATLVIRTRD